MPDLTHAELVERAGRWLRNTRRCVYVLCEPRPWACAEHPDAIGWLNTGESIVVECKISIDDCYADRAKSWRTRNSGMGFYRYWLTPPGLFNWDWLAQGTGILEMHGRIVKVIREAEPRQDRDWSMELRLLLARLAGRPSAPEPAKDDHA